MPLQINRKYSLIVGDVNSNDGLLFENHQITFDISRTSDNSQKTNSAAIEIYNLNDDEVKTLEDNDFLAAQFKVAYNNADLKELFSGQVVRSSTKKSGPDRVTQIIMGEGYVDLNQTQLSGLVPSGKTVKDVVKAIFKTFKAKGKIDGVINNEGISRGVFSGTNLNNSIIYGYPLSGNPTQMLNELASTYGLEWHTHGNTLYVNNKHATWNESFGDAPVISKETGLIDNVFSITGDKGKKAITDKSALRGIQFRKLIDTEIICGQIIKVEDDAIKGWYIVDEIRYTGDFRGNDWYMDIRGTEISQANIQVLQSISTDAERRADEEAAQTPELDFPQEG